MSNPSVKPEALPLDQFDPDIAAAIAAETERQERTIDLIASENYVSRAVLDALGSSLTNKYADGYPGKRDYTGCEHADVIENLAIERARALFGAAYANVQPYSGTQANASAYFALLEPGDLMLSLEPAQGGHPTHGGSQSFSGRSYRARHYRVDRETGTVDFDEVRRLAEKHRPKLIVAGFSANPRIMDWQGFREIADHVDAYLLIDMAHVAGLVAAGLYPDPVAAADVVTSTTHKTLRGPRGGLIVARNGDGFRRRLDRGVYPGNQGGPLLPIVAAKAVAFREAAEPAFADYQRAVVANARHMCEVFAERGIGVWTGGTDSHLVMLDLGSRNLDGATAEAALERAGITVNRIRIPGSYEEAPSGLRLGTPAITTRGMGLAEAARVAHWVADVLDQPDADTALRRVRQDVEALGREFPIYT
ncbi:MAG TPA: serine hydroxymethyltransferase [Gammaproteobacteria bacterium]|nr:serine hydroxymethyltransferase [Gammaproteobacteria bacterium]